MNRSSVGIGQTLLLAGILAGFSSDALPARDPIPAIKNESVILDSDNGGPEVMVTDQQAGEGGDTQSLVDLVKFVMLTSGDITIAKIPGTTNDPEYNTALTRGNRLWSSKLTHARIRNTDTASHTFTLTLQAEWTKFNGEVEGEKHSIKFGKDATIFVPDGQTATMKVETKVVLLEGGATGKTNLVKDTVSLTADSGDKSFKLEDQNSTVDVSGVKATRDGTVRAQFVFTFTLPPGGYINLPKSVDVTIISPLAGIPTLSTWGVALLGLLLVFAWLVIRSRRRSLDAVT